jgi:hypothetical protein
MTSLQARLSAGLIAGAERRLTALAVALGGYSLRQLAEDFVAGRLEHDVETLLAALTFGANWSAASGRPTGSALSFRQPYSGHYYRLVSPGGVLRFPLAVGHRVCRLPPLVGRPVYSSKFRNAGPQGISNCCMVGPRLPGAGPAGRLGRDRGFHIP